MTFKLNGVSHKAPSNIQTEWITVSGALIRQLTFSYQSLSGAELSPILSAMLPAAGCDITYLNPWTNAEHTLVKAKPWSVSALTAAEQNGVMYYAPVAIVMRYV